MGFENILMCCTAYVRFVSKLSYLYLNKYIFTIYT